MVTFFQRRGAAATEALLLAILVATFVALTTPDATTQAAARERAERVAEPNYGLLLAAAIGEPTAGQRATDAEADQVERRSKES